MKTTRPLILCLAGLALFAPLAFAQEANDAPAGVRQAPRYPVVGVDELQLRNYTPKATDLREIFGVLRELHGRTLLVQSGDDEKPRTVNNMTIFGRSLILYDLPDQIERIERALDQLEHIAAIEAAQRRDQQEEDPGASARLEVMEYTPRFVSLSSVQNAAAPFVRQVRLRDQSGTWYTQANLTLVRERGCLVLRDTPDHLAQMRALFDRIDLPRPQVLLSAQLILASPERTTSVLPAELSVNLSKLVGYENFEVAAASTLRTSVGPDREAELQLDTATETYSLQIECSAYDEATGALSIEQCTLRRLTGNGSSSRLFSTSCVVAPNEYTVLGSSGKTPLFAVLRVVPVAVESAGSGRKDAR